MIVIVTVTATVTVGRVVRWVTRVHDRSIVPKDFD
jgi:hypothetical protein